MAGGADVVTDVALALILVVVAIVVSRRLSLSLESDLALAAVRAIVQIAVVAATIQAAFSHLGWSGAFLVVMLLAGAWTSGRRLAGVPGAPIVALVSISVSAGLAVAILFGTGVFDFEPRFLIPIAGMLIGNAMIATSLAGNRLRDEVASQTPEIEARIALGVSASEALLPYRRRAVTVGLLPTIDATKNVGLILLPGAFVGMVIAGASPADAARVQLIVLFMLLGAVAVAGMTATILVARSFVAPGERLVPPRTR
ncbi:MAG: ABC transporter permease [Actinomycetota bacterium]